MARRLHLLLLLGVLWGALAGCGHMLPAGSKGNLVHYTVKKGDTLYSISWRYGCDHREVASWNNIRPPYNIYPGDELVLIAGVTPRGATSRRPQPVDSSPVVTRPPSQTATKPPPTTVEKLNRRLHQARITWRWPTQGSVIAGFNPAGGKKGMDIQGKLGQAIYAAADGSVVYSGSGLIGYGNLIIIKHDDTYLSAYGHNKRLLVKEGTAVKQGQKIAEMGDSGKDGVILHFEIRRDGKPVNPKAYLPAR